MNKKARKRLGAVGRLIAVVGPQHKAAIMEQTRTMTAEEIDVVTNGLRESNGPDLKIQLAKRDGAYLRFPPAKDQFKTGVSLSEEDGLRVGNIRFKGWKFWRWVRCEAPLHKVVWHEWQGMRFRLWPNKKEHEVWWCKRCDTEVIDKRCRCETSPSPWERRIVKV